MATHVRSAVTVHLTENEFSAINGLLHEIAHLSPSEFTRKMRDADILVPINHAEDLVQMWSDLHDL